MRSWVLRSSNKLYLLPFDGSQRRPSEKKGQIGAENSGTWLALSYRMPLCVRLCVCLLCPHRSPQRLDATALV